MPIQTDAASSNSLPKTNGMDFWNFIRAESDVSLLKLLGMAALSGFSNALLLAIINAAAQAAGAQQWPSTSLFVSFVVTILLFILSQRFILRISSTEIERMIGNLRVRIADKIHKADLLPIEGLGQSTIYAVVSRDTQTISQAAMPMIIAVQSAIMVLFIIIYIAYLNISAFVITSAMILLGILFHLRQREQLEKDLYEATVRENDFFTLLTHLLEGFKEVKLNTERSAELNKDLANLADSVVELKSKSGAAFASHFIFSQTTFYVLIAGIVFILPSLSEGTYTGTIMEITAAILFMIGPLSNLIGIIPLFSAANVAVTNIRSLEASLDELRRVARDRGDLNVAPPSDFHAIRLSNIRFAYRDRDGQPTFPIGPIELTIHKQEVLFVIGGNGSGKSTFLKLLTALYYPESGKIELDGHNATEVGYASYRNLFSAIFSDYHLFDRLYGVHARDEEVNEQLRYMELEKKTKFVNGRFVNQDLSTGQRKRLALIVSLLEDRPIYVFDEWAADQDPAFRKRFYTEILPNLRTEKKKTIIAATHDDLYFDVADRVLKMENGGLSEVKR